MSSKMAAAADEKANQTEETSSSCSLYRCFCCWRRACSPRIPRVAPGRDYLCIPAGADDSPAWSLLVGFLSDSNAIISEDSVLGLHRFRVAQSGRVFGGSDDVLDILHTVRTTEGCSGIASAAAALTPNGRSLCLFSEHLDPGEFVATPRAQQLRLTYENARDGAAAMSELPRLPPECPTRCRPVSAAGHLWAPNIKLEVPTGKCFVGMLRLDRDADRWEKAGDTFPFPLRREDLDDGRWGGPLFQGYSVLHEDTILVSLRADHGLLSFNCSDCTWTEVTTTKDTHTPYIPILGLGVYIKKDITEDGDHEDEDDGTVYFLRDNEVFAYKLSYCQDQEDRRRKLKLEPPVMIDSVCPFREEGHGFLTHLGGKLMCSVWINTWLRCSCDFLHVLITTFRVRSSSDEQKGIDILHSTCRRLDVFPVGLPIHEFCFLQEYEDKNAIQPPMLDYPTSPHVVEESTQMLDCCSNFLSELGYYKFEEPPQDPALQINKDLYIICKAKSQLIVYVAKIENGRVGSHDKLLTQKYALNISNDGDYYHFLGQPPPWHLVFSSCSSNIYAISSTQDDIHVYSLMEESKLVQCTRPTSDPFSMVLEVGDKIIAVRDNLHLFCHDQSKWVCCTHRTDESPVLNRKADLSGYAILDENCFIVSDTNTSAFLLFDLRSQRWSVLRRTSPGDPLLNGRSVFVDGFIYTCTSGGLLAYELLQQGHHKNLGDPIFFKSSWQISHRRSWVAERMCLDCADKDKISDAIIFCVVQGEYCISKSLPGSLSISHEVHITTVQVKTERAHRGKIKPERIDHMDIGTCFIEHDAALVCTKSCFAVGS